jgi:hypothetical protein
MNETGVVERPQPQEAILGVEEFIDYAEIEATARYLIEHRDEVPEVPVLRPERRDNARTALMEAMTTSGFLSRVEVSGTLDEVNRQVLTRLLNGWDDSLPMHEKLRRFPEICEELINQKTFGAVAAGLLPADTAVAIISDCPTVEMPGLGYRYKNLKGMTRSTHLQQNDDGTYTRVIEQVSRSNSDSSTTFPFLASCGVTPNPVFAPDVAGLRAPVIYRQQDYAEGVVAIQRRLDKFAGPGMLYGEAGNPLHPSYEDLRRESARREEDIEAFIDGLADLETRLDKEKADGMSKQEAQDIYSEEVMRILNAVCILNPEYTEATYGARAVPMFDLARQHVIRGEYELAQQVLDAGSYLKESVIFCGMTISLEEAQRMGIAVNSLEELIKKGKEGIKYKPGICRVESCPTRPGKTDVGPCSVCRTCQYKFDHGGDPTTEVDIGKVFSLKVKQDDQEDSTIKAA